MKYALLASIILTASFYAYSQVPATTSAPAPAPVTSNASEHLSKTEELAIRQVESEIQQVNQDMVSILSDIQKDHPGYTYDFRANSLTKIQQPPAPPAPPAPAASKKVVPTSSAAPANKK